MPFTPENKKERNQFENYPKPDNAAAKKAAAEKLAKVALQNTVNNKPKK